MRVHLLGACVDVKIKDDSTVILQTFQQHFSHFKSMGQMNKMMRRIKLFNTMDKNCAKFLSSNIVLPFHASNRIISKINAVNITNSPKQP